jgi:cytidine deaminase
MDQLFEAAAAAQANAYAPYSSFAVGAAVRTAAGTIYSGANVENASYPVGNCAEASAIAAMVVAGERHLVEILIVGDGDALATPCGACRQRIFEFAGKDAKIYVAGPGGIRACFSSGALLPEAFGLRAEASGLRAEALDMRATAPQAVNSLDGEPEQATAI